MPENLKKEATPETADEEKIARMLLGLIVEDAPPFGRDTVGLAKICAQLLSDKLSTADDREKIVVLTQFLTAIAINVNAAVSKLRLQGLGDRIKDA